MSTILSDYEFDPEIWTKSDLVAELNRLASEIVNNKDKTSYALNFGGVNIEFDYSDNEGYIFFGV